MFPAHSSPKSITLTAVTVTVFAKANQISELINSADHTDPDAMFTDPSGTIARCFPASAGINFLRSKKQTGQSLAKTKHQSPFRASSDVQNRTVVCYKHK